MAPVCICCLMVFVWLWGNTTVAWGQATRPRGLPSPLATQATATSGGVSLQGNVLSVQVQDEELRSVLQNIAAQGNIELRHMEGIPDQRISIQFSALPVVEGLKRLLRTVDLPGYAIVTAKQGKAVTVQRIVFVSGETPGGMRRSGSSVASLPPSRSRAVAPRAEAQEEPRENERSNERSEGTGTTSVFEDLKTNATARRLVNQLMHPNEQVRERALESLVRLVREDDKQRDLLEFVEPLMEDLASEDKETQEEAREEIRQLLRR